MVGLTESVMPWHRKPVVAAEGASPQGPQKPETQTTLDQSEDSESGFQPFGEDGFTFLDLIDVVNPLHHIPVVGPVYREMTGDVIGPLPRITGSTLYFGPIGAGLSVADVVLQETTGRDTGEHMLAMMFEGDTTQTASRTDPVVAGTDGEDPVTAWARQELDYRRKLAQHNNDNIPEPVAAGTDGVDPVTAWARETHAANSMPEQLAMAASPTAGVTGSGGVDPVTAWARQTLADNGTPQPAPVTPSATVVAAGTDGIDPVTAWARAEKSYRAQLPTSADRTDTSPRAAAAPRSAARPVHVASAVKAYEPPATMPQRPKARAAAIPVEPTARGATAPAGGWFADAMLNGLDKLGRRAVPAGSPQVGKRQATN